MCKRINFSNPLNGRKWLKLLIPHKRFGITFKKNLDLDRKYLGFSFKTNQYGLRGTSDSKSDLVICGTSYAMGLSVDSGDNWYEHLSNYFNIGMPIGFDNFQELLNSYYNGSYKTLIYLYHPNQIPISINYGKVYLREKNIFELMSWKTDIKSVIKLYFKWIIKQGIKKILRKEKVYKYDNIKYYFNPKYNYLNTTQNIENIMIELEKAMRLFEKFENVYIFKIPIKEEIVLKYIKDKELCNLQKNFNERWELFKEKFNNYNIYEDLEQFFELDDYLPYDTHWSKKGNKTFLKYLKKRLNV